MNRQISATTFFGTLAVVALALAVFAMHSVGIKVPNLTGFAQFETLIALAVAAVIIVTLYTHIKIALDPASRAVARKRAEQDRKNRY